MTFENGKTRAEDVLGIVDKFIRDNEITVGETIYQMDRVQLAALEFIEELCEAAGYHEPDADE